MSLNASDAGDPAGDRAPRRRRGKALESALLDAAWEELVDTSYQDLTYEAVAERAATSRAVIYRRWPTKPELVRAALAHADARETVEVPDTGSLRDDVVELLRRANRVRSRLGIVIGLQLSGYFAETGTSPADLRAGVLGRRGRAIDTVIARAIARGEVDPSALTPRVVGVPFDLFRQELLMTLRQVPDEVIEAIVDEVFLPLATRRPATDPQPPAATPPTTGP